MMTFLGLALSVLLAQAGLERDTRAAVGRSLPFIEKGGTEWRTARKCSSCHHVTFMIWSHREAMGRGFAVDPKKLDEWTAWAVELARTRKTHTGEPAGEGLDTMAQLILARPMPTPEDAGYRDLATLMLGLRGPWGGWAAGGQLPKQRRPAEETNEVSTAWTLLSLRTLGLPEETWKEPREKALEWLAAPKQPPRTVETLAVRLLMDHHFGKGARAREILKELLARRSGDGGWSWMQGEPPDALGTGVTLYALTEIGDPAAADPIRRAAEFLVRTQREDGSWPVASTKTGSKEVSVSTYWGTSWAAIGLLRTLATK